MVIPRAGDHLPEILANPDRAGELMMRVLRESGADEGENAAG